MINKILNQFKRIKVAAHWRVFIFNFLAIFVLVGLQQLHLKPPPFFQHFAQMISPIPQNVDVFGAIKTKLKQKDNNFEIKKPSSLIPKAQAGAPFSNAAAYAVVNLDTGEVLDEKNLDKKVAIASLTKIMTAVVALDLADKEEMFTVSKKAAEIEPTKIGVEEGQQMSLDELLHAALMTSANDAVEVIREGIDNKYDEDNSLPNDENISSVFVRAMNTKAEILGLKSTHFQNPQGFDNKAHFSSAKDLVILSQYALENYPLIKEITQKNYLFLNESENHKQFDLYNWNGLLDVYPGIYGVKIGNTGEAGKTTAVVSQRDGKKVMAVVLGAPTILDRDLWASELLDSGFTKLGLQPVEITEAMLKEKYQTWKYFE